MLDQDNVIDVSLEPRKIPPMQGWQWIVNAFVLFKRAPLIWLGICLVYVLALMVLTLLPTVGDILATVLGPVFLGGVMWTAHKQSNGEKPFLNDMFCGFRLRWLELIKVGALLLIGIVIAKGLVLIIAKLFGLNIPADQPIAKMDELALVLPFILLNMAAASAVYSVFSFAPALVMLQNMAASEAMKLSLSAFCRNWQPILVMSVIGSMCLMLAILPPFLGLLVALPVALITSYFSYSDIFKF